MYVFKETVDFIGHTLSKAGISPQKHKVEAIRKPRAPRNLTELKAYLGLLNYYGRFIPNLSSNLRELHKLLRKGETFVWSDRCDKSFLIQYKLISMFLFLFLICFDTIHCNLMMTYSQN